MKIFSLLATALAVGLLLAGQPAHAAATAPGNNFQIDAAHDGAIRFKRDFHAPLKRKWIRDLGNTVSYPVSGDGKVFVTVTGGEGTVLYALSQTKGLTVWQKNLSGNGGTPVYDNGRVFVVSTGGFLQSFSSKDGKPGWTKQLSETSVTDPPTVANGLVYVIGGGSGGIVYAFKEKTGALHWFQQVNGSGGSPSVGGGLVYVGFPCHDYGLNDATGAVAWANLSGCSGGGGAFAVYYDDLVFMDDTFQHNVLVAQTGANKRPFVAVQFPPAFWTPVSGSPLGFMVDGTGALSGFNPSSGHQAWSLTGVNYSTAPVVLNDTVFIGDTDGNIYAYDPQTGGKQWSTNVGASIGGCCTIQRDLGVAPNMLLIPAETTISAWVSKP